MDKDKDKEWKDLVRLLAFGIIYALLLAVVMPLLLKLIAMTWARWLYVLLALGTIALVVRLRYLMHLLK